jgi:hypothetical protein
LRVRLDHLDFKFTRQTGGTAIVDELLIVIHVKVLGHLRVVRKSIGYEFAFFNRYKFFKIICSNACRIEIRSENISSFAQIHLNHSITTKEPR